MKIEQVKIEALIPYARNSRTHSDGQVAQIAASIKEFGFTNPVLIDETGSIIAGHGRVMAARKLGLADLPSIRLTHLTEAQKRAYVIADNKLALNAGWDDEMLAVELTDLKDMDFNLDMTGFIAEEIAGLNFKEKDLYPDSSTKEIDPDDYNMGHQCPKCGFEFDDDK
jgi:ParB-like chromosome segregation protein Spo0J